MASYESLHTLLLQKHMDNILRRPVTLATTSTSLLAWILTFVASAISSALDTEPYPSYCWFSIAFMLLLTFGIFAAIMSDTIEDYRVAIVGFLAAGLILTTSSVNNLLYTSNVARQAAAAGFIVLSIVNVVWIFYVSNPPKT